MVFRVNSRFPLCSCHARSLAFPYSFVRQTEMCTDAMPSTARSLPTQACVHLWPLSVQARGKNQLACWLPGFHASHIISKMSTKSVGPWRGLQMLYLQNKNTWSIICHLLWPSFHRRMNLLTLTKSVGRPPSVPSNKIGNNLTFTPYIKKHGYGSYFSHFVADWWKCYLGTYKHQCNNRERQSLETTP